MFNAKKEIKALKDDINKLVDKQSDLDRKIEDIKDALTLVRFDVNKPINASYFDYIPLIDAVQAVLNYLGLDVIKQQAKVSVVEIEE